MGPHGPMVTVVLTSHHSVLRNHTFCLENLSFETTACPQRHWSTFVTPMLRNRYHYIPIRNTNKVSYGTIHPNTHFSLMKMYKKRSIYPVKPSINTKSVLSNPHPLNSIKDAFSPACSAWLERSESVPSERIRPDPRGPLWAPSRVETRFIVDPLQADTERNGSERVQRGGRWIFIIISAQSHKGRNLKTRLSLQIFPLQQCRS